MQYRMSNNLNKSLPADVQVRIRGRVVQVPVRHSDARAIVPVPTEVRKHAPHIPITGG